MKLSKRLQQIDRMVNHGYDHIWDCCCDHGFLGASLLEREAAAHIHFVDIVPELINNVTKQLSQFFPDSASKWHTHCLSVVDLPLHTFQGKHLIIIAGVGGDLLTEFINALQLKFSHLQLGFLICPVYQQYKVRKQLNHLNFKLHREVLVEDNQRFYEVIYCANNTNLPLPTVSLCGESIWIAESPQQFTASQQYLDKTLKHYQRMSLKHPDEILPIIKAYQSIKVELIEIDEN